MEREERLEQAGIPEEWWEESYLSEEGDVYTPRYREDGTLEASGEKVYRSYVDTGKQRLCKSRLDEIKGLCEERIVGGFEADVLGRGVLRYTLTTTQQEDMKVLMARIQAGAAEVLWHDSSRVMHEVYTAGQFSELYRLGLAHTVGCKIRSDGLEQYVTDLLNAGETEAAKAVNWETTLPEAIQAEVDAQIAMMLGGGGE